MANIAEIAKLVLERTQEGRLAWEATAGENSYLATLGNQSVRISRGYDGMESNAPVYSLSVLNKDGLEIENLSTPIGEWMKALQERAFATPIDKNTLPMIFLLARRRALEVDKELDELAKVLSAR